MTTLNVVGFVQRLLEYENMIYDYSSIGMHIYHDDANDANIYTYIHICTRIDSK